MTMANVFFNSAKVAIATGQIDFDTDTFKLMLVTDAYTPDQDTHDYRNDVTNEITGTGYTAGGATLASVTVTVDNTNNRAVIDAADTAWTSASFTARGGVLYKARGGASSADELVCAITFGSDLTVTASTFTVQWNASGIITLS